MVTVGMYYEVIPEKTGLFLDKFREVLGLLQSVPGHTSSFLYQRVDDPNSYAIMSEWEDRDAFLGFIRSETFRGVTDWGREQVLRRAPRHTLYPGCEPLGRPE